MNHKLTDAVAIFKELGWEAATAETVLQMPLGTPEQKRTALAGLRSGDWGDIRQVAKNTYGYVSDVDVDEGMLAVFAVCVGVDARRAAGILRAVDSTLTAAVIAQRGAKYAVDFIGYACVSRRRMWEHSASVFGNTAVRLVDSLDLDIPQNVQYLKDWSVYAAHAMGISSEIRYKEMGLPGMALIEKRFAEHIQTGVAVGAPATGPFGKVLPAGVTRGWLPREEAVELVFAALDAAVRPADRKVWLDVLGELRVSDADFCARTQSLIPLLSAGDPAVVQRLAPILIAGAEGELLPEVLTAAFSATTKKAKLTVLKAALDQPNPGNTDELTPWLTMMAGDKDRAVSNAAARLMKQWNMDAEALPEEDAQIQGLWQKTPPVWQVSAFTLDGAAPEALTELAAEIVRRPALVHDVTTERFLAVANAVAYKNPEAVRTSLRGLRFRSHQLTDFLLYWVNDELPRYGTDEEKRIQPLLGARDYVVCQRLDKLPCLLSTPSFDDLSITVPDLAARLEQYQAAGIHALEADLFLALTRLDATTITPQVSELLQTQKVFVELQSGKTMPIPAGEIIPGYLDDPIKEPAFTVNKYGHWAREPIVMPESLRYFPNRFDRYASERFSTFPLWGDASLTSVRWDSEVYHEKGLIFRQVARRAAPLPPGGSINLLAAQRSHTPDAAEDAMLAVDEAWERGLLRPGVADTVWLDWSTTPPSNLAALAMALDGIARDGLLSVVWPILDGLIAASLKAPRIAPGTADLAELMGGFLPEVELAIKQGLAEKSALDLPAVRVLAQHGGSSRAVSAARELEKRLPTVQDAPVKESLPMMEKPFEEVWPAVNEAQPPIEDGVAIAVDWADPEAKTKQFCFTLTIPGTSDQVFQVVKPGWYYDLEREGQCEATPAAAGATAYVRNRDNRVWLHWDEQKQSMVVCDHRNWAEGNDGPLKDAPRPALPSSLLTIIIGLLAQDGDAVYFAPRLLQKSIEEGRIGSILVHKATQTLLQCPVVSPAKLVRSLEKDIQLLPVLWPMLTESVKEAGVLIANGGSLPVWLNRVLNIAHRYAPYLKEAAIRGLIPPEDAGWIGLHEIAASKAKSTAVTKAKKLLVALE